MCLHCRLGYGLRLGQGGKALKLGMIYQRLYVQQFLSKKKEEARVDFNFKVQTTFSPAFMEMFKFLSTGASVET